MTMAISDQIDALQKRTADLKSSFEQSRKETNQEVKARLDKAKAEIADRQNAVKEKAEHATNPGLRRVPELARYVWHVSNRTESHG
jgi:hypothetical protein